MQCMVRCRKVLEQPLSVRVVDEEWAWREVGNINNELSQIFLTWSICVGVGVLHIKQHIYSYIYIYNIYI